ncbi:hypothetical protein RJ640_030106 [Escallonia rubra]|uniref:Pentatricopeptide repeat-containing protein n=1 Tax=Escallonia rubra TaxID=112253 RepID=A0AA88UCB6_9ASTE|nr:hypothetical protein RJ640_030106 [Escallonia rubra]
MLSIANRVAKLQRCQTLMRNVSRASYHTNSLKKDTLYSKISPLGSPSLSLKPELDEWVEKGKRVRIAELQRIIHDLRKRKRYTQALEVSEWMNNKGLFTFSPTQHAVQLDLVGRVNGFLSAESYFNNLTEEDKTDKTYGALLHCYVRQRQKDKALSQLQKMKDMGFKLSTLTYNDVMCLYAHVGEHDKVHNVLMAMKNDGVSPDNLSYRLCINSSVAKSDVDGVENILKEMESQPNFVVDWNTYAVVANFYIKVGLKGKALDCMKQAEERLDSKDGLGYNHLISLHSRLGNKAEVLRLWGLEKAACERCINRDYINVLEALVRLGELEEAERLLNEWESSGNCYDYRLPNTIVVGYCGKGLHEKAKAMLDDLVKRGMSTNPESWSRVAAGYLDKGDIEVSVECMKVAFSLNVEGKGWKPNLRVLAKMLSSLGEKGSIEEVEAFVALLRSVIPVSREMYHALITAYIRGGKKVEDLLTSMKADGIETDKGTKKILSMKQSTS